MGQSRYVQADSALVRAAEDLLGRHTGEPGGICASCGMLYPCPSARHAAEVRHAAGLSAANGANPVNGRASGERTGAASVVPKQPTESSVDR